MHVVSVNKLILFFSCEHGHFCPGVVSWWGDITIREEQEIMTYQDDERWYNQFYEKTDEDD